MQNSQNQKSSPLEPKSRIVCLTATGLDCLKELDLEPVGYLNQGVADRPEFYGDRAQSFTSVGSWLFPDREAIRASNPDLILGWRFPHRFYRRINQIAPVHILSGTGYESAKARLLEIGELTGRSPQAEATLDALEIQLDALRQLYQERPSIAIIGGSAINRIANRYPAEADTGTLGSVIKDFTTFPWSKPTDRGEAGLMYISLQQLQEVDPEIIFVQSYGQTPLSEQLAQNSRWQQLQAVQRQQVFEIPQLWHWGNGIRMIRLGLMRLLPLLYPHSFEIEDRGLRQRQLCERMGRQYRAVAQTAKRKGITIHGLVQQETRWRLIKELYYPPLEYSDRLSRKKGSG
ncbi:MAG: ABC transporter substrate-binding protein [Cyanobacteria bacterium P01_F01_bin.42]